MPETTFRQHQWSEIAVTPVTILEGVDGEPVPFAAEDGQTQTQVGCFVCNMGLSEGFNVECPGQDLFEDD